MTRLTHLLGRADWQPAVILLCASIILFTPRTMLAEPAPWGLQGWSLEEFQPNISNGGRANTIAVHPTENSIIFVTSESGGLFKSASGGKKWGHVDSLPVFYTNAVAFASDPKIVIVTASEDFSTSNRGGIWRSDNGGDTWTQVVWKDATNGNIDDGTLTPNPSWPCGERFSAYEISMAPETTGNIYVADSCGVSISSDQGKTWKHVDPFGAPDQRVASVTALPVTDQGANLVLVGGPAGVVRSLDGGQKWDKPTNSPGCNGDLQKNYPAGCIADMHAFGRSPIAKDRAYVVNGNKELYYTETGGDSWTPINVPQGLAGCGGISFVKAKPIGQTGDIILYFGNRCTISRVLVPSVPGTNIFNFWLTLKTAHGDTRDIAFDSNNNPLLLATDGGLEQTADGGLNWTFVGGGNNGYNALQIYEVRGQWIKDISQHNLYFGTQDNSLWSSGDVGKTWTWCCNEGNFIEAEYRVATSSDAQITFFAPSRNWKRSGVLFQNGAAGVENWYNPPGQPGQPSAPNDEWPVGWPKIVRKNFHIQGVDKSTYLYSSLGQPKVITYERGLAVNNNFGDFGSWQQYATFDDDRRDLPGLSFARGKLHPVLYQLLKLDWEPNKGVELHHLARIDKNHTPPVTFPLMNNFGGVGIAPTMSFWYHVFAVNPRVPNHLIAADIVKERMMETTNGGDDWTEMPQLTSLVTDGGKLKFSGRVYLSQFPPMWSSSPQSAPISQASVISFYPDSADHIAVGTVQNGIFISPDRGKTWAKVPGSERATLISSFHWRSANDIIVSTYGRGLWRARFKYVYVGPIVDFTTKFVDFPCPFPDCYQCLLRPCPPYDQAVLAYGGGIQGARVIDGILQELFIQPNTSVAFLSDSKEVPDVKVTETKRRVGFLGAKGVSRGSKKARIITALTLRKSGKGSGLVGVVFSPKPMLMYAADEKDRTEDAPVGREQSPTANRPYLEVLTGPLTGPGRTIELAGRGLKAGSLIEIAIDNRTVQKVVVGQQGKFSAAAQAPNQVGLHSLTIIDSASRKVLHGGFVAVRPEDEPRPGEREALPQTKGKPPAQPGR